MNLVNMVVVQARRQSRWALWGALVLGLAGGGLPAAAQPVVQQRAHAHNDYEHARPLLDALDHGFGSVEADVHLVDGRLLVAHDSADVQPGRPLEALYLDPLRARARANGGRIYPIGPPLTLLIDIKTDADATYAALREVLRSYADILTIFAGRARDEGAVTAVISGNRPRALMEDEAIRYAAYDGRLEDLDAYPPASATFIPLVSSSWTALTAWEGQGALPDSARVRLEEAVTAAHAQGRQLRFWATADTASVWRVLYEAGVDWLGSDNLGVLRSFLLEQDEGAASH